MDFLKKLKSYIDSINTVEENLLYSKMSYKEVYERNLLLEKEIKQRTKELEKANKTFLTLGNIWEMMNSEAPLSSILNSIVEGLLGEFGYVHSAIFQIEEEKEKNQTYFLSKASSKGDFAKLFYDTFSINPIYEKFEYKNGNIFDSAITSKEIIHTENCIEALQGILPRLDAEKLKNFNLSNYVGSIIAVPIFPKTQNFGVMLVFSSRKEASDSELTFLKMFAQQIELAIVIAGLFEAVKKQAVTDALTDLYNRRYFENALFSEVERSKRQQQPFSIVSLDLDHLKVINDKFGHQYGDLAIQTIAKVLKNNARSIDIPARFGGEEFNVLLPGIDSHGGKIAAERIRAAIEAEKIDTIDHVTASIGVVTFLEHTDKMEELLELADQAMYRAKLNGRNQVCIAETKTHLSWQEIALNAFIDILSKHRIPIDQKLAQTLVNNIHSSSSHGKNTSEILCYVADALAKTYDFAHTQGTSEAKLTLAMNFAKFLELPKEDIDNLRVAILLYDIGNVMLPEEILNKPQALTQEELKKVHKHPIIAAREILEPISNISDVIPIIEFHHENWDGSGYPFKKAGREIPITSQIILLIDAYFALLSERPHRHAYSKQEALEILKNDENKKFEPNLVKKFIFMIQNEAKIN